jgi:trans-aconitate 2-methyltransferase
MPDVWNPDQYERFRDERKQPFRDLLALVQRKPGLRAVDLGCGTGEPTLELHQALQASETLGVDRSESMLARAAQFTAPGLRFEQGDIESFGDDRRWDLIFSNAAFHWVRDHRALFARLRGLLALGGQLAVQMPNNFHHASHRTADVVAAEQPFRDALVGWRRAVPVLTPDAYAALLHELGFREQVVLLRVYGHELKSRAEVVEWTKGTLLTDYEKRLGPELYAKFLARYRELLLPQLADTQPYFFTFPRLLLWAR